MCPKHVFANYGSPSRRPSIHRFRFARNAKHMNMKDAQVALDIVIHPSVQLWKVAPGRSALSIFKRSKRTVLVGDDTSSTSSITSKKKVRFDEKPVTISRRGFFERWRKDSSLSSPARPCLVVRMTDDARKTSREPSREIETDAESIYEDCLSSHPDFVVDLGVLEGDDDTRSPKRVRGRSEFYEMESGIAMFDQTGYANYCLSRWLEKQREASQVPQKRVLEDAARVSVSSPNRTLPPPEVARLDAVASPAAAPKSVRRSPRSLPWRIYKYIEDELQNAIVVLIIGLFIHVCLFLFLLYDILVRGFVPSDD